MHGPQAQDPKEADPTVSNNSGRDPPLPSCQEVFLSSVVDSAAEPLFLRSQHIKRGLLPG